MPDNQNHTVLLCSQAQPITGSQRLPLSTFNSGKKQNKTKQRQKNPRTNNKTPPLPPPKKKPHPTKQNHLLIFSSYNQIIFTILELSSYGPGIIQRQESERRDKLAAFTEEKQLLKISQSFVNGFREGQDPTLCDLLLTPLEKIPLKN